MRLSINNKLIERNKKISQIMLYASLALLIIGFFWTIRNPEPANSFIGYVILVPAYLLVQMSIFMANRWGKSPRPDEIVLQSMKGLDDKYTLFNYTTDVPHLLVGPIGVWIINPYHQKGVISYNDEKKRYVQKGGPNFITKYFAQEGLPNISREVSSLKKDFNKYLVRNAIQIDTELVIVNLFYSDDVSLHTENAPDICIKMNKLKVLIRNQAKKTKLPQDMVNELRRNLPSPD